MNINTETLNTAKEINDWPITITEPMAIINSCYAGFAPLFARCIIVVSDTVPTCATDGKTLYINTGWLGQFNPMMRVFVLVHELMHNLAQHMRRASHFEKIGRGPNGLPFDRTLYNVAGDDWINATLLDGKVGEFPCDSVTGERIGLYDSRFDSSWSVDEIYAVLCEDKQNEDKQNEDGDDGAQDSSDDTGDSSDDNSDDTSDNSDNSDDSDDSDEDEDGDDTSGDSDDTDTGGQLEQQPQAAPGHGGWDIHLKPPTNIVDDIESEQQNIDLAIELATQCAGNGDSTGGDILRKFKSVQNCDAYQNWQSELADMLGTATGDSQTSRSKVNRRGLIRNPMICLPGYVGGAGTIGVQLDMSISTAALVPRFLVEVGALLEQAQPELVYVFWTSHRLHRVDIIEDVSDWHQLVPIGSGGTDMRQAFAYCNAEQIQLDALITFTDNETPFPEPADCEAITTVIWCAVQTNSHSKPDNAPIGTTIHINANTLRHN